MEAVSKFFRRCFKSVRRVFVRAGQGSAMDIAILAAAALFLITVSVLVVVSILKPAMAEPGSEAQSSSDGIVQPAEDIEVDPIDESLLSDGVVLAKTDDAGTEYLEEIMFIGDSNTARLVSYGPLGLQNVFGASSMGIQHVLSTECMYFKGETKPVFVAEAVKRMQPRRIIINYGTNNTSSAVPKFIGNYEKALDAIHNAYPYADIIIAAVLPITRTNSYPNISMQRIAEFNNALAQLAKDKGYHFLNTSEAFVDAGGYCKEQYMSSDGIHLNEAGVAAYYEYVRTHAYVIEDTRPAVKNVPTHLATPDSLFGPVASSSVSTSSGAGYSFTLTGVDLMAGATHQLNAKDYQPSVDVFAGKTTTWASSDTSVATIDGNGLLTAIKGGSVKISCQIGDAVASCTVRVFDAPTASVPSSLEVGKSAECIATQASSYKTIAGKDAVFAWSSSDSTVAKITTVSDTKATVEALKKGTVTITLKMGGLTAKQYTLTVGDAAVSLTSIAITGAPASLTVGGTATLGVAFNPDSYPDKTVTWTSSNNSILSVSGGTITAVATGSATITATAKDGKTATVTITVAAAASHSHTEDGGTVTANPTCTQPGVRTYKCTSADCNYAVLRTDPIPALGHAFENGVCTRCGEADPNSTPTPPSSSNENSGESSSTE